LELKGGRRIFPGLFFQALGKGQPVKGKEEKPLLEKGCWKGGRKPKFWNWISGGLFWELEVIGIFPWNGGFPLGKDFY